MASHGSRGRYKAGCRCQACTRREGVGGPLRWPIRFLMRKHDHELVQDHVNKYLTDPHDLDYYRQHGLTDQESDRLACSLGDHPMLVWPGWMEAGLDDDDEVQAG